MSSKSIALQSISLKRMVSEKMYIRERAGLKYYVLPEVYKGAVDSELMCAVLDVKKGEDVWDIGTGTGIIALYAKKMGAGNVLATDKNPAAIRNARKNSKFLNLDIHVKKADVFGTIKQRVDVITFNPPFTDHPGSAAHHASFWDKGNISVRKFFRDLHSHLRARGRAFICWSSFGGVNKLKRLAKEDHLLLKEVGRRKGSNGFTYYVFRIYDQS